MVVDVTHSETPFCVGGTVAIEETAFTARLTSTRFLGAILEILRDRAWTVWWGLTRRKDVLEAGARCADANHRRADEGQADHNGTFCGVVADWNCGELRCRDPSCIVAPPLTVLWLWAR
jgi:hypothetical protein